MSQKVCRVSNKLTPKYPIRYLHNNYLVTYPIIYWYLSTWNHKEKSMSHSVAIWLELELTFSFLYQQSFK